jgi:hypothetical protein
MERWPLILTYINGISASPFPRYEDKDGNLYVPLRLFNEESDAAPLKRSHLDNDEGRRIKIRFHSHNLQLQLDEDQAMVDGTQIKLNHRIRRMGEQEAMVALSDLPKLLGVPVNWDKASGSIMVEAP